MVGSSITSTLDGLVNSRASSSRFRSPPESRATGTAGLLGREEKIFQVADDVPRAAVDRHRVRPVADVLAHRFRLVQLGVELVEVGHLQVGAVANGARLRRQLAQQQPQERRLARAVGADQPHPVAAHDHRGEVADDRRGSP